MPLQTKIIKAIKITGIVLAVILLLLYIIPIAFPGTIAYKVKKIANERLDSRIAFSKSKLSFFSHFPYLTVSLEELSLSGSAPDAKETKRMIEQEEGRRCLIIEGDLKEPEKCQDAINRCIKEFKALHILVNNIAVQFPKENFEDIRKKQLHTTFETNIYTYFYIVKAAMKYLKEGDVIINTSSVTAFRGSEHLVDYASTKGAIVSFTRALSAMLVKKKIRVNGVAPGPIWTPLIPASFKDVSLFGKQTPMGRAGQPSEVGPAYVFLACDDSSYITGQFIHVNGGEMVGG